MVDLALSNGPVIGPFAQRSKAIEAEEAWLSVERFLPCTPKPFTTLGLAKAWCEEANG